jgi:hypothetical protein
MKTRPIITVAAIDVECPTCHEFIAAPSGSLYFTMDEVKTGEMHACLCGTVIKFPALKTVKVK